MIRERRVFIEGRGVTVETGGEGVDRGFTVRAANVSFLDVLSVLLAPALLLLLLCCVVLYKKKKIHPRSCLLCSCSLLCYNHYFFS